MQLVKEEDFLTWASGLGLGFDPRYPGARSFGFVPPRDGCARFWMLSGDPATWPEFVASFFGGLDQWSMGFLWPRSGRWPSAAQSTLLNERVCAVIRRGAGIPEGWPGALRFEQGEQDTIIAVLFAHLVFGWCVDDDLYFVPDHGRQSIQTDHHDVVHVECATEARVREFVAHMAKAGYALPTEPPDETFKRQSWMDGKPSELARDDEE